MAAEISMLIRRVLLAFNKQSKDIQFFATSATLGDPDKDGGYLLRKFAADLFSKELESIEYIDGSRVKPLKFDKKNKPIPTDKILDAFQSLNMLSEEASEDERLHEVLRCFPSITSKSFPDSLYQIFTRNESLVNLVNSLIFGPKTLTQFAEQIGTSRPLAYSIVRQLATMKAADESKPLVKLRLHSVVEAPDGIFYCPTCKTFYPSFHEHCPNPACNDKPLHELVVCKDCGEAYLCSTTSKDGKNQRINWRSKNAELTLQILKFDGTTANSRQCSRCGNTSENRCIEEDEADISQEFDSFVIDPEVALYKQVFFSAISVSIDLIQKIAIDTLYANLEPHKDSSEIWMPGAGRRLLTFTDNRQGAAKLPTALDWLHEIYLGNRIIYDSIRNALASGGITSEDPFDSFSERGLMWLEDRPNAIAHLTTLLKGLPIKTEDTIKKALQDIISQHPNDFRFSKYYGEEQLLDELVKSQVPDSSISFEQAQESISKNEDLREMAGIFEKIDKEESWDYPDYRRQISYWVLLRSLGILSKSQYLPENSGLFKLEFSIPSSFLSALNHNPVFSAYSTDQLGVLVLGLINHMRGNGGIDARWPQSKEDPLSQAAKFVLQNALVNQYYVLERSMIEKNAPSNIKSWYSLETQKATAPINIIRKALGNPNLSVQACQNVLAELWPLMTTSLGKFFKPHETMEGAYSINLQDARITENPVMYRCPICHRTSPHHLNGYCISGTCFGKVETLAENQVKDLYGYKRSLSFPKLGMRTVEHTAQLDLSELTKNEKMFIDGQINVLSSSTTMELGIDIGGITSIFLANCPPGPSNYLQRAGRAGRRSDRLAYVLTSARKVPLDHYFFLHPDLFFTRKPHDPYVSLNSEKIVKRHLNSFVIRSFFNHLTDTEPSLRQILERTSNPLASYGTVKVFFGFENNGLLHSPIIEYLLKWLDSSPIVKGIEELLAGTALEIGFNPLSYFAELRDIFQTEYSHLRTYITKINDEIVDQSNNEKRQKVLEYYRDSLFNTDIVSYLIDLSILPKYGFPTDVVSLNTLNKKSRIEKPASERTANKFRLQRSSDIAINEYAPGAQLIAGKRLIISRGISFSSYLGGEGFSTNSKLEQRRLVECNTCRHFYVLPPTVTEMPCPVCGTIAYLKPPATDNDSHEQKINTVHYGLLPKGFRVDYQEEQPYAPNKIDKATPAKDFYATLQTEPEAFIQIVPDTLRIASTQSATFYAINKGPFQKGYTICPTCGRSTAEHNFKPVDFKNHDRLYSNKRCTNGESLWHNKFLVAEFISDAIQIRFANKSYPIEHRDIFMKTFARCLQLAAAKYLGIDARELRFLVQAYYEPTTSTWDNQEIVLYDDVPGGAGYSEMIVQMFGHPQFYSYLMETTECPDECNDACPACLITFEKEDEGHQVYNRHLVREFLARPEIKGFFSTYIGKVKPNAGDRTINDIIKDLTSLLMGKTSGKVMLYFNALPKEEFSVVNGKFGTLLEIAKRGIDVSMVFPSSLILKSHTFIQQNLMYGLAYAGVHLSLRIRDSVSQYKLAAVVDDGKSKFVYENYLEKQQEITPFDGFPFIRKQVGQEYHFPEHISLLKLDAGKPGIMNMRTQFKQVEHLSTVKLWHYVCEYFDLDATKPIASVWYSDRYLLQKTENLCFLMLLDDMPLQPRSLIHVAVNSEKSTYSDLSFPDRLQQQKFFDDQARLNPNNKGIIKMYCTTMRTQPTDPGQLHQRELQITYIDGSSSSFSFDSGMSFFAPFIDRYWNSNLEHYTTMMQNMAINFNKKPRFKESLIFYYPEASEEEMLATRFKEAIVNHRIKAIEN